MRECVCIVGTTCMLCLHLERRACGAISHGNQYRGREVGGDEGGVRGGAIGKESRLSPVINRGNPRRVVCVCVLWGRPGFIQKNTDCLASGEGRQLSVLINASQRAH